MQRKGEGMKKGLLIIPDVHGRDFWKEGIEKRLPGEKMIFLGDYTDPYDFEGIKHNVVPGMIREILEIPDTILLLGNHDLGYIFPGSPKVRQDPDRERFEETRRLFLDNHERFRLTWIDEGIVFSHAGFLKSKYNTWRGKKYTIPGIAEMFQQKWEEQDLKFLGSELFQISWLRGGWSDSGSFVWADIREHLAQDHFFWSKNFQIFGHSMLKTGYIIKKSTFAMVDCQRPVRVTLAKKWRNYRYDVL